MIEIVGIRFKPATKIYYFSPENREFKLGDNVIVETVKGIEYGSVVIENRFINEEKLTSELKPIIREADETDTMIYIENKERAKDALKICEIKVKEFGLDMKLVDSEYTFDGQKLVFYFIADGRIDFRELVKDLAQIFKTRIELRQVGVRDHAKMLNSIGQCGQKTCCSRHLSEFEPVSIKMAKDQGLSLNPNKISGVCGRLMCCLKYEQEIYEENLKNMPELGEQYITTTGSIGEVCERKVLERKLKLRIKEDDIEKIVELKIED